MEPFRLRRWRVTSGRLFTCGRPGRSNWKDSARVPENIIHKWVRNLPAETQVIVSLLGKKPNGTSEYSFYPFSGGFDDPTTGKPAFAEWLQTNFPERHMSVREHPTEDFAPVPKEVLAAVAADISYALSDGGTVVLVDSGGQSRTGAVCKYMRLIEQFS
jgi:hypothetical protein